MIIDVPKVPVSAVPPVDSDTRGDSYLGVVFFFALILGFMLLKSRDCRHLFLDGLRLFCLGIIGFASFRRWRPPVGSSILLTLLFLSGILKASCRQRAYKEKLL